MDVEGNKHAPQVGKLYVPRKTFQFHYPIIAKPFYKMKRVEEGTVFMLGEIHELNEANRDLASAYCRQIRIERECRQGVEKFSAMYQLGSGIWYLPSLFSIIIEDQIYDVGFRKPDWAEWGLLNRCFGDE